MPLLIVSQFGLALIAAVTIPTLGDLPLSIAVTISRQGDSFALLWVAEFTTIFFLMLAPVANRLAVARDGPRRERFLSRTRQISEAKRLVLEAMAARESVAALARTGREDEARLLFREAEELLERVREINPREPAVAQRA